VAQGVGPELTPSIAKKKKKEGKKEGRKKKKWPTSRGKTYYHH
jgi:hypothetical protein